ncbi:MULTISPECIES: MDR family MFS transporter [Micromonospora]|uniref:MFS transporter n=1 Tax=Micromonospora solifontis TaxID=2487138 RepID=A0ABX9WAP9_9ACTN|nr:MULTISPECIES: MDR family MFS transporter [Micromonospora]NES14006.1 MFS transporter [Micromonospora sp. PPF5-17B]NES38910.1 MFS transporter [Micromonospora solifontis]NES58799.1 MFS transporter [Micromonospora sp. PPF5-6]RNL92616.1 MFS transporter [Micromonospora solifontis]
MTQATAPTGATAVGMTHRQILEALSGLLLGMFVAILSSTVVSNALPRIITELHGGQSAYTWVVTSTLLATTATTPIWGKLADLTSKKVLVQLALGVFVLGSVLAGLSQSTGQLIACRVVQGVGAGGLTALAQVIMATMIAPRERGRYSGYLGAVMALGTIGGPLIGGVIVDTDWLGWRWCFYVGVPFAALALVVLQKTLHLPVVKRQVKIDWWGATLITAAVSLLLIWITLAGDKYDWISWQSGVMVAGALLLGATAIRVEQRASEPMIPPRLFRSRTITLAVIASIAVGVGMFGASVFLGQYFQISRGESPTMSGLMTLPMIGGLLVASTVIGRIITNTGRWKRYLVAGSVLLTAGFATMGTLRADTPYWRIAIFMALIGLGLGMTMQNLVLAVQNTVGTHELGAASSVVAFFRSLGGAIGVSALGAVLGHKVKDYLAEGLAGLGIKASSSGSGGTLPDVHTLPAPIRAVVEAAYGHGAGDIFLAAAPFGLVALIAVLFIKEVPLRRHTGDPVAAEVERESTIAAGAGAPVVRTGVRD